jgi:hypothetical protein
MEKTTIYKLIHEDGPFVIGSTNDFKKRIKNHKKSVKEGTSDFQKYVRENGGWEKVSWEILKEWNCSNSSEQFREEGKFINEVFEDPLCYNMKIAGITPKSPIGKLYILYVGDYFYLGRCRDDYHRFASHKTASKTKNTLLYKKIREIGGWDKVRTEILREWICSDLELKEAEDKIIRENLESEICGELCLNSMPASTTPERERELSNARVRKWVENHPDEARDQNRIKSARWRENNPEKVKEVQERYNEKRKSDPKRKEYNKEYYEKNREELNRKKREKRALEKAKKMEEVIENKE